MKWLLDLAIREPSDLGESRVCAGVRLGRKGGEEGGAQRQGAGGRWEGKEGRQV